MNRHIPGVLTLDGPTAPEVPVVFDSPHSGTVYPDDFDYAAPDSIMRTGEDTYVEELYAAAPRFGAAFLKAHFPRAYIDPNRAVADIDQELLGEPWPEPAAPSIKTTSGIGLIWRLAQPDCPIYARKLTVAEVKARIATYYEPYQRTLMDAVDRVHQRFGGVWHVNCHSMPAVSDDYSPEGLGIRRADFVLGDRDGTTCAPAFTAFVADTLGTMGYRVVLNDPFKGVELVRMVGAPTEGRHSLQIEINRDLFVDDATKMKTPGFEKLTADITALIGKICDFAVAQGGAA
jgi:N-formylglutamate amidohydrolase